MTQIRRWLRICIDLGGIGTAILAAWAIPLLHEHGLLALLPSALMIAFGALVITAIGCTYLWFRHVWHGARASAWLSPIDPFLVTNREM